MLALLLLAGISGLGTGCKKQDEATRIRQMIDEAAGLAEAHAVGDLVDLTTPGFKAEPHGVERSELQLILLRAFRHYGSFVIIHPRPDVTVEPPPAGRAKASVPFIVLRKDGKLPPLTGLSESPLTWLEQVRELGDPYLLELALVQQDGEWKVDRARLDGGGGMHGGF